MVVGTRRRFRTKFNVGKHEHKTLDQSEQIIQEDRTFRAEIRKYGKIRTVSNLKNEELSTRLPTFLQPGLESLNVMGATIGLFDRIASQDLLAIGLQKKIKRSIGTVFFQQNGAICDASRESLSLLKQLFAGPIILLRRDLAWLSQLPVPLRLLLWEYLTVHVVIEKASFCPLNQTYHL